MLRFRQIAHVYLEHLAGTFCIMKTKVVESSTVMQNHQQMSEPVQLFSEML